MYLQMLTSLFQKLCPGEDVKYDTNDNDRWPTNGLILAFCKINVLSLKQNTSSWFLLGFLFFFTPRQWSCGKARLPLVCLFTGGPMWPLPMMHWASLYRDPSPQTHTHTDMIKLAQLGSYRTGKPPGGYWSIYGWQAGGTYHTGMLSCSSKIVSILTLHSTSTTHRIATAIFRKNNMFPHWQQCLHTLPVEWKDGETCYF